MNLTILFFKNQQKNVYACQCENDLKTNEIEQLKWLFDQAEHINSKEIKGCYIGVRKEMVSPWSTNAVEITKSMGIQGVIRIEEFIPTNEDNPIIDSMLQNLYQGLTQQVFHIDWKKEPVKLVDNLSLYNQNEGLALNDDEISFLKNISEKMGRKLTDAEVFGFSQVNSEHCRHKIFNGEFVIDGKSKESSLFSLIKETSKKNPKYIVSAYKDNVAFFEGSSSKQFYPNNEIYQENSVDLVYALKAETHNFPTTVEPFSGAATGSGGEIRDRLSGGIGSSPLSGSAVYMTPYSRLEGGLNWERVIPPRKWKYQSPINLLIKASNGASDFGNKFGQPLINGSVFTFEYQNNTKNKGENTNRILGFDKVIMLAGGIGFAKKSDALKKNPQKGDKIILLGGDNYRIGMGGGAVSSLETGILGRSLELNAVQRSNPEMQKRVANVIRALTERTHNPIISIHDHGAGGHLNCLSELVEDTGGKIDIDELPIGDETLSLREILCNESQERIGLVVAANDVELLKQIADRERAPLYIVGSITEDMHLLFESQKDKEKPINLPINYLIGDSPKTVLYDETSSKYTYPALEFDETLFDEYLEKILQLEAVACKDWLTNKVDRCVSGRVALQQTTGELQLPLNNLGAMMIDFECQKGIGTSIGHAPIPSLINPTTGTHIALIECLLNLIWAPLTHGMKGIILSANWMWPAKTKGENHRLYSAVQSLSDICCELSISIPTGKDSLSMKQVYPDGQTVAAPGTVIISSAAEVEDVKKIVTPVINTEATDSTLYYINFTSGKPVLSGTSFAQILGEIGDETISIAPVKQIQKSFQAIQQLVKEELLLAGHDVSSGGLITTLLEMTFANTKGGLSVNLDAFGHYSLSTILFSENPACIIQVNNAQQVEKILSSLNVDYHKIGKTTSTRSIDIIRNNEIVKKLDINQLRKTWRKTSYLIDKIQSKSQIADNRNENYEHQSLTFKFPKDFDGSKPTKSIKNSIRAAVIREEGANSEREMAFMMNMAGFQVKDIHMTDLIHGREDLSDVNFIVFVGGFANSDVLGSAKGWAGAFKYNPKAKKALEKFYNRDDTMSLGVCNGCQLMMELGLIISDISTNEHPKMHHNASGKFECQFVNVDIVSSPSIMLSSLENTRLGVWSAHAEGRFVLPKEEKNYNIALKYSYNQMPGNPNGSDYSIAALVTENGRHLAMMPHLERSIYQVNWGYYPPQHKNDIVSPWYLTLKNAFDWINAKIN